MKSFRSSPSRRPAAVRSTLTAVGVALAASALGSALFTVALDDSVRYGLLGKAGVLMVTSYPNRTSPVLRG